MPDLDEAELLRLWREEIASAPSRDEFEADVLRKQVQVGRPSMTEERKRYMAEYMRTYRRRSNG